MKSTKISLNMQLNTLWTSGPQKCVWQTKTLSPSHWDLSQIFRSRRPHNDGYWARERPKCFQSVCSYLVFHIHNWAMFHSLISHCIATAARKQCYKCCVSTYSKEQIDYLFSQIAFRLNLFMVVFLSLARLFLSVAFISFCIVCCKWQKRDSKKQTRS